MLVIVSSFLMIFLNDLALLLYGEISCWSSLGLNGLRREKSSLGPVIFFLWGDWLSLLHMFKVEYAYSFLLSVVHHESRKIAWLSWPLHALSVHIAQTLNKMWGDFHWFRMTCMMEHTQRTTYPLTLIQEQ